MRRGRASNKSFRRTARHVNRRNHPVVMRGGIRF